MHAASGMLGIHKQPALTFSPDCSWVMRDTYIENPVLASVDQRERLRECLARTGVNTPGMMFQTFAEFGETSPAEPFLATIRRTHGRYLIGCKGRTSDSTMVDG